VHMLNTKTEISWMYLGQPQSVRSALVSGIINKVIVNNTYIIFNSN
jgi:hypothetical protein